MNDRMMASKHRCRCHMAEHIASHEPQSGEDLRVGLGWRMQQFFDAVYGWPARWFVLTIRGWELTEQGREGLAASLRRRPCKSGIGSPQLAKLVLDPLLCIAPATPAAPQHHGIDAKMAYAIDPDKGEG